MEEKEFEKRQLFLTEKVEVLTIEELKQTVSAISFGQSHKTRPVEHYKFIEDLMGILLDAGQVPTLDHIYCAKAGGTKIVPKVEEQIGIKQVLDAWILDKVTGKIILEQVKTNTTEFACCIAFSYHDKGMDLAFGSHVWDCQNMSIFGSNVLHTYGAKKDVSYQRMLEVFKGWANNLEAMHARDIAIITSMKNIVVSGGGMLKFLGKLMVRAIEANMGMKVVAPLNVTQVGEVTRGIINLKGEKFYEGPDCTLWEFYNFMTEVMKGNKTDITSLITDLAAISDMMVEEYKVLPDNTEVILPKTEQEFED